MPIGVACKRSLGAARKANKAQEEVISYCLQYARSLTGNENFKFDAVPEGVDKVIFNAEGDPPKNWSTFIKQEVRSELVRSGYRI